MKRNVIKEDKSELVPESTVMQYVLATAEISHGDLVQKSGDDEVYGAVFDDCT